VPLFFGGRGLGLQGGLDGLAGQLAGGGDGEGLDAGEDQAVGCGVGGLLQLLGQEQGLLEEQGLQGGLGVEGGALGHGSSLKAWVPRGYRQLTETTRNYSRTRSAGTAIYYLLTPDTFSALHRLSTDEIFHFYLGDPVEMLHLLPDGSGRVVLLGNDLYVGDRPQIVVPGGTWQGSRLVSGGRFALMGTTMAPGFDFEDYEHGDGNALTERYPAFAEHIARLV
jgi:predicted cupin superfamily sugar epimerase